MNHPRGHSLAAAYAYCSHQRGISQRDGPTAPVGLHPLRVSLACARLAAATTHDAPRRITESPQASHTTIAATALATIHSTTRRGVSIRVDRRPPSSIGPRSGRSGSLTAISHCSHLMSAGANRNTRPGRYRSSADCRVSRSVAGGYSPTTATTNSTTMSMARVLMALQGPPRGGASSLTAVSAGIAKRIARNLRRIAASSCLARASSTDIGLAVSGPKWLCGHGSRLFPLLPLPLQSCIHLVEPRARRVDAASEKINHLATTNAGESRQLTGRQVARLHLADDFKTMFLGDIHASLRPSGENPPRPKPGGHLLDLPSKWKAVSSVMVSATPTIADTIDGPNVGSGGQDRRGEQRQSDSDVSYHGAPPLLALARLGRRNTSSMCLHCCRRNFQTGHEQAQ